MEALRIKGATFKVDVLAYSTAYGCYQDFTIPVVYNGDPNEFQQSVLTGVLRCGYTSISKYKGVMKFAIAVRDNRGMFEAILDKIHRLDLMQADLDALSRVSGIEATHDAEKLDACVREYAEKGIELEKNGDGKWFIRPYLGGEGDYTTPMANIRTWLSAVGDALELLGYDPDNKAGTRRMCENIGMYR